MSDPDGASAPTSASASTRPGVSWLRVALVAIAVGVLGGAIGYLVGTRQGVPATDSVDVGFYQDMISHHEQAIQMAAVQLASGSDPRVSSFAREILQFQSYEIGLMRQQLAGWGIEPGDRPDTAMGWMGRPVPVDEMPGLATPEQVDALRNSQGAETDALFLELMAAHHIGGVAMADHAAGQAERDDVRRLASTMARNQAIEVNEFRALAERLGLEIEIPAVPDHG
ncbi:MAG: DUF305 domain-containing protein [Acidimicrobiales bacterium]